MPMKRYPHPFLDRATFLLSFLTTLCADKPCMLRRHHRRCYVRGVQIHAVHWNFSCRCAAIFRRRTYRPHLRVCRFLQTSPTNRLLHQTAKVSTRCAVPPLSFPRFHFPPRNSTIRTTRRVPCESCCL